LGFHTVPKKLVPKSALEDITVWKMNLKGLWNVCSKYFDSFESSDASVPSEPDVLELFIAYCIISSILSR
jgi:hypothetical protein